MAGKRRVTGRALKFLFASGILRGKGSGKNRTTTYDKGRAQTIARNRKRGVDVTKRASRTNKSGRFVFGGSKVAGLRSGSGTGRRVPSKAERDATRAGRIAAGLSTLGRFAGQKGASFRRANPYKLKEMTSKFDGKFADTRQSFKAGDKIYYGRRPRQGEYGARSFKRPGNSRLSEVKFKSLDTKGKRTATAVSLAAQRWRQAHEADVLKGVSRVKKPSEGFGLLFRNAYRATPRPRWKKGA